MPFPANLEELRAQGYEFKNESECRACHARIDWYQTPAGKRMPMDKGTATPHWGSCPNAKDFKRS